MKKYLSLFSLAFILTFAQISFAQSSVNEQGEMFEQEEKAPEQVVDEIAEAENQEDSQPKKTNPENSNANPANANINSDNAGSDNNSNDAANSSQEQAKEQGGDENMSKQDAKNNPLENILVMELKYGKVVIQLRPDLAPNHVARIKQLAREGFYDGVVFHRVIEGFMAQTGDPTGTGRGGSGIKLEGEFSEEAHVRGSVSMARAADPNSADSQFFIVFEEAPHLDKNYTLFGEVTEGMEFVDKIKKGFGSNGMVSEPDKMISLKVASDIDYENLPKSLVKLAEEEDKLQNSAKDEKSDDNKSDDDNSDADKNNSDEESDAEDKTKEIGSN